VSRRRRAGRVSSDDLLGPLDRAARAVLGRPLGSTDRERFRAYLDLLARWNRTHDLTGCKTAPAMVSTLFRDSVLFASLIPGRPARTVDIGAGAGIPGVPLHLLLGLPMTLIEARRKRVSFLRALARELGLSGVEVIEGRAEAVIEERSHLLAGFDLTLSRGIPLVSILGIARRYLKPGGLLIAGGPPRPAEPPSAVGYASIAWRRMDYPGMGISRTFLLAVG